MRAPTAVFPDAGRDVMRESGLPIRVQQRRAGSLRYAPWLAWGLFLLPVMAGVAGTILPAFGYLPAIGGRSFSLAPWRELFDRPGFATSLRVTVGSGIAATLISLALCVGVSAWLSGRAVGRRIGAVLAPILAAPHSALAIGLAFVLLPSGWIARAFSPWLTGWSTPPDIGTVGDAHGVALVAALVLKETPFLLLMTMAALNQIRAQEHMTIARSMGYGRAQSWVKVVLPLVYPQLRLPVYAVLAFSLSVVDVALVLGPRNPATLGVIAVEGFAEADLHAYFPAAAAACLQLLVVVAAIGLWRVGEWCVARAGRRWIAGGARRGVAETLSALATAAVAFGTLLVVLAVASLVLWSFAAQWRFPDAWPGELTVLNWMRLGDDASGLAVTTIVIGVLATALALIATLGCLENESRRNLRTGAGTAWLLYTPLLVPQVAFLFGMQVLLVWTGYDGTIAAVVWAHVVFVLPYVFLSLAQPWRALDPRYARAAASLGASPTRVLWRVKLPLLLTPILIACAVGFAVSAGLYLPTLFAGNGRVDTLTTTAVTLASGADRRTISVYALLQMLLPWLAYVGAVAIPAILHSRRKSMPRWL